LEGGQDALFREADDIARSDVMDLVAGMLIASWGEVDRGRAGALLLEGLRHVPDPLAFAGTATAVVRSAPVLGTLASDVYGALLARAKVRGDPREAYIAANALEGALRLVLSDAASPPKLLVVLSELSTEDQPSFAVAAARSLGVLYVHMPEPLVRNVVRDGLLVLTGHAEARADAEHELGLSVLTDALEGSDAEVVEQRLRDARRHFDAAIGADAERVDALLYARALDCVLALIERKSPTQVETAAASVEDLALVRAAWQGPGRFSNWLGDRAAAEGEWWMVTATFAAAVREFDDDPWLNAGASLEAIARAYRATRIARVLSTPGEGLRAVVEPRISETFARVHDRQRALTRWAAEMRTNPELGETAAQLTKAVARPTGSTARAIAHLRAQAEDPDAIDAILETIAEDGREVLERRLETFDGGESVLRDPSATHVRDDIRAALKGRPDYDGQPRMFFDRIVDMTIAFVQSRLDLQSGTAGGRWSYLSKSDALERHLQMDYYEFLKGTHLGTVTTLEVPHVGGGRADVVLQYGSIRVVAEIKRDDGPVEPGDLDSYLNQAGLYQSASVALGLLLILDLSPKPGGQVRSLGQSFWVADKPALAVGDAPRSIVTAIVAGNRPTPSGVR
jgi:hypothetical protein